jgi:hypothetical protein
MVASNSKRASSGLQQMSCGPIHSVCCSCPASSNGHRLTSSLSSMHISLLMTRCVVQCLQEGPLTAATQSRPVRQQIRCTHIRRGRAPLQATPSHLVKLQALAAVSTLVANQVIMLRLDLGLECSLAWLTGHPLLHLHSISSTSACL